MASWRRTSLFLLGAASVCAVAFRAPATPADAAGPSSAAHKIQQTLADSHSGGVAATTATAALIAVSTTATLAALAKDSLKEDAVAGDDAAPPKDAPFKKALSLKTVIIAGAKIADEKNRPHPAPGMSVADFLASQLGKKFHRRSEWAGHGAQYNPIPTRSRTWGPIGTVRALTIHHAEGVPDEHPAHMIRNIFMGHTTPGGRLNAADVGYHFFVDKSGDVWEGRSASKIGTHVGSTPIGLNNSGNLGICGLGTYLHEAPPKAMVAGIVNLSKTLCEYYGKPLGVRGHEDWVGVNHFFPRDGIDCPGRLETAVTQSRQAIVAEYGITPSQMLATLAGGESHGRLATATQVSLRR